MLMVHSNFAGIENGELSVDRKFHDGMLTFASAFTERIVTVNPRWVGGAPIMDLVRVPLNALPYDVLLIDTDHRRHLTGESQIRLERGIAAAPLVVGQDFGAAGIARRLGVPYVSLLEYDLGTQIVSGTIDLKSSVRRLVRSVRIAVDYYSRQKADVKGAAAIHCNGYPIYDALSGWNDNRLLYLDSRMPSASVIDEASLESRLASLPQRRLRLLFSGRYEAMKGATDAVAVAVECQKRGLAVEFTLYGQGSQRSEMDKLASAAPDPQNIRIHDAVPFPELIEQSRLQDIFVCCHPQSDPSCTYLESFGAGLPIVGYANRMWRRLSSEADAGIATPLGNVGGVVEGIMTLAKDYGAIARLSRNARRFALEHCAEREFDKRIAGMKQVLNGSRDAQAAVHAS